MKAVALAGLVAVSAVSGLVLAGPSECPMPGAPTDARFVALTKLAGDWEGDTDGDGKVDSTCNFKVTSGGHAVLETMFPGTDHEMITIYHMDHAKVRVTHYCLMGNAPSMVASGGDAKRLAFEFDSGANVDAGTGNYMGGLVMEFKDADHFDAAWAHFESGKKKEPVAFHWSRKK